MHPLFPKSLGTRSVHLIAVGDLSLNGNYHRWFQKRAIEFPVREILANWKLADAVVANLESPVTTAGRVAPAKCVLRGASQTADFLKRAGIRAVNLANNHAMDFGPSGLADSIRCLNDAGIEHCGGGSDELSARSPSILEIRGQRIAIHGFCDVEQRSPLYAGPQTAGVARLTEEACLHSIRAIREQVDWVILQLHWGQEMSQLPSPAQRALAARLIEAGADVIIGHHPHVLQPVEYIQGKPVAYSLGNFLFSAMFWRGTKPDGERFASKLRLHPLSRKTAWAEITLSPGRPVTLQMRLARLNQRGCIVPDGGRRRAARWQAMTEALAAGDFDSLVRSELARASSRHAWRWSKRTMLRRMEGLLFRAGLVGRDAEGY